jgi:hypothetical protein
LQSSAGEKYNLPTGTLDHAPAYIIPVARISNPTYENIRSESVGFEEEGIGQRKW